MQNKTDSKPRRAEEDTRLRPNPTVARLVQAQGLEAIVQLDGLLDRSQQDRIRLYRDLSLRSYLEVAVDEVLDVVVPIGDGIGRHKVFVKGSAQVRQVTATTTRADSVADTYGGPTGSGVVERIKLPPMLGGFADLFKFLVDPCSNDRERIANIQGWIDWCSDRNSDGRFNELIEKLEDKKAEWQHSLDLCEQYQRSSI